MKKLEIKISHFVAAALSGLISLLGFSACKTQKPAKSDDAISIGNNRELRVMYGVPSNVYKVRGVVNGPGNRPVGKATIVVSDSAGEPLDTVHTNPDGTYFTEYMLIPGDLKVVVTPDDDSLTADSTYVESSSLLKNKQKEVNFKLKKRK